MTDKMSKEEARAVLNEFLSRNHLELVTKAWVQAIEKKEVSDNGEN